MALNCVCPLPSALPTVGNSTCAFDFDQVIKLGFQMVQSSPSFATAADIEDQAEWNPLLAASGSTKVVVTPPVQGMVIPASEGNFEGGNDNTTVDGIRIYKGEDTVTVEGMFYSVAPSILKKLRELSCFSLSQLADTNLTAYLFTGKNEVVSAEDLAGIKVYNFRVGATGSEGYRELNKTPFSFELKGDWDSHIAKTKLDFDPRNLLNSVSS